MFVMVYSKFFLIYSIFSSILLLLSLSLDCEPIYQIWTFLYHIYPFLNLFIKNTNMINYILWLILAISLPRKWSWFCLSKLMTVILDFMKIDSVVIEMYPPSIKSLKLLGKISVHTYKILVSFRDCIHGWTLYLGNAKFLLFSLQ